MHILLTAVMAPALKSCFETTINLKQNNLNFGETIYLKSRADRQAAKRYRKTMTTTIK
jgi:hypothetical protein